MLKTITHPLTGARYKLGRTRPQPGRPKLHLQNYLMKAALPQPPAAGHYSRAAEAALALPYLNTDLGDCAIAGPLHCIDVIMGNAGSVPTQFSDADVVSLYSAIGGYDPSKTDAQGNNPTDAGCDEQTMLSYWQTKGMAGHKIAGWISVKPEDARTAMWLFENLIFGLELPDAWVDPAPAENGFTWDVAGDPDQNNGHCFIGVGWNDNGIIVDSWGLIGQVTYAAIAKYAVPGDGGELYAVVSQEMLDKATQKAAAGVDWTQMVADFDALGGGLKVA